MRRKFKNEEEIFRLGPFTTERDRYKSEAREFEESRAKIFKRDHPDTEEQHSFKGTIADAYSEKDKINQEAKFVKELTRSHINQVRDSGILRSTEKSKLDIPSFTKVSPNTRGYVKELNELKGPKIDIVRSRVKKRHWLETESNEYD